MRRGTLPGPGEQQPLLQACNKCGMHALQLMLRLKSVMGMAGLPLRSLKMPR